MGRERKPTAILELNGTIKQRPQRYAQQGRELEPQPTGELGKAPKHLTEAERRIWREFVKLCPPGVLKDCDQYSVEQTVFLIAKMRDRTITTSQMGLLLTYLGRFGMTPADRSKVHVDPKYRKNKEEKKDDWASFTENPAPAPQPHVH